MTIISGKTDIESCWKLHTGEGKVPQWFLDLFEETDRPVAMLRVSAINRTHNNAIQKAIEAVGENVNVKETFDGSKRTWQDGFVTGKQLSYNQSKQEIRQRLKNLKV